jgi:hypothetical protein
MERIDLKPSSRSLQRTGSEQIIAELRQIEVPLAHSQSQKQNTVPLADRTIPEAGQYGPSGRTVVLKKAVYGT